MRILHPRDNALFLVAWRERMRPATILAGAVVTFVLVALILVGSFSSGGNEKAGSALESLSILQGAILFILGSYQVGRVAAREREGGTIAFHRTSPTSRLDQVLGIIIGAPALEWFAFAATFVVSLVLLPMSRVSAAAFFGLYVSMIFTALFFHSLAALFALATGVQKTIKGNVMGVLPAILLLIAGSIASQISASTLYHSGSMPFFDELFLEAKPAEYMYYRHPSARAALYLMFGIAVPSIIIQLAVQAPLGIIAWLGTIRVISNPDRPVFSKKQVLAGAGVVLFLFVASATSYALAPPGWAWDPGDRAYALVGWFIFVVVAVGVAGEWISTPTHLLHLKGLRRARKLGREGLGPLEDAASSRAWLIVYCLLVGAAYATITLCFEKASPFALVAGLVVILCYVVWFGQGLEYFRLGPYRKSWSLFAVAIALLWILIPMFGVVLESAAGMNDNADMLCATSPFFGLLPLAKAVAEGRNRDYLYVALVVNLGLVVLTALPAMRARRRCIEEPGHAGSAGAEPDVAAGHPGGGKTEA